MIDPDSDWDLKRIPWQILIRARFAHELDALLASAILSEVARFASHEFAHELAKSAFSAVSGRHATTELTDAARMQALLAVADWDDICPVGWPYRPRPHRLDEFGDPMLVLVLEQSIALVETAGSERLQKALLPALQLGAQLREPALSHA